MVYISLRVVSRLPNRELFVGQIIVDDLLDVNALKWKISEHIAVDTSNFKMHLEQGFGVPGAQISKDEVLRDALGGRREVATSPSQWYAEIDEW